MSLLSKIPGRSLAYFGAALALAAAGAGVAWWGMSPRIDLAQERADRNAEGLEKAYGMILEKDAQLQAAQDQAERNNEIGRLLARIRQDVARYNDAQDRALEELRKHDQLVEEYLRGAVPAQLGRLYERPETTDPAAYGSPAILLDGTVPPTRPTGSPVQ